MYKVVHPSMSQNKFRWAKYLNWNSKQNGTVGKCRWELGSLSLSPTSQRLTSHAILGRLVNHFMPRFHNVGMKWNYLTERSVMRLR